MPNKIDAYMKLCGETGKAIKKVSADCRVSSPAYFETASAWDLNYFNLITTTAGILQFSANHTCYLVNNPHTKYLQMGSPSQITKEQNRQLKKASENKATKE